MPAFLDNVAISVHAGRGGRGSSSFRREKYIPNGGPDGGDGGKGGDVRITAGGSDTTLSHFRDRRKFTARNGGDGSGNKRRGADGHNCNLSVPPGTIIYDASSGVVLADLDHDGATVVVAHGGRGGRGNVHFATSVRQAPKIAELGTPGEDREVRLELRLIADVGLVGLPNAGKSTLLSALSGAKPKIAAYPFTTLTPNLGVAEVDGVAVVLADVPGLIEGASEGVGLGVEFLRHLQRTRALIHVVDASAGMEAAQEALAQVDHELRTYDVQLAAMPQVIALNKIDDPKGRETAESLSRGMLHAHSIAAATGEGCEALLRDVAGIVAEVKLAAAAAPKRADASDGEQSGGHRVYRQRPQRRDAPIIVREGIAFRVHHTQTEKLVAITDMHNEDSVLRLQKVFRKAGIDDALMDAGCVEGDTVRVGSVEFDFQAEA